MATPNYVLLQRVTVSGTAVSSVVLSNLPSTGYTDLKVVWSARNTNAIVNGDGYIQFNGSSANYTNSKMLYGSGSAAASASQTQNYMQWAFETPGANATANSFSNGEMYIANYTSSNNKTVSIDQVVENKATEAYQFMNVSGWNTSAAITSITFVAATSTIAPNSTFAVYGLAAVGTTPTLISYATGGDIIKTDGTYWYHAFLSSGTFTPAKGLSCDILQVGAGAGGGYWNAGGGGAGGVTYSTSQSLASGTAQTIAIGAGGAGSTADGVKGTNGATTQFGSLTAIAGGGGGGSDNSADGAAGASGGGGAGISSGSSAGGTASNGSTGGAGRVGAPYTGGGGGGFGGAGATGAASGNGGIGTSTYNTSLLTPTGLGVSGYIAAGGGGGIYNTGTPGAGGSGGGGNGGNTTSTNGIAATANTGSGGGGAAYPGIGGNGGSGLVIIRYAV